MTRILLTLFAALTAFVLVGWLLLRKAPEYQTRVYR